MPTNETEIAGPNIAARWRAKADALHASGDAAGGAAAHMQALAASVRDPSLAAAASALTSKDLPRAERLLKEHLSRWPTDIGAMRMLAELAARIGRNAEADALLQRALHLAPGFDAARFARALVLSRQNKLAEALEENDRLLEGAPNDVRYQNLRATILVKLGDYEGALALYDRVLAASPHNPNVLASLGHLYKTIGKQPDSIKAYREALSQRPEFGESWWSLANLKTYRFSDADVETMRGALASTTASEDDRLHIHYALGKAFEDAAKYERSFEHYSQGAKLRRDQIGYDADQTSARVRRTCALFSAEFFAQRRGYGCTEADPIFIIGLPRAGSTLIEQILASNPLVEGTMELPDIDQIARRLEARNDGAYPENLADLSAEACRTLGEEYLERTRVQRRLGRPFFIDKMPNNWMHTGLIKLILPNAKIVDARRHPMANCFSAWKQHFARGQAFSYDLTETGRYYTDYVALMNHFDAALPGQVTRIIHEQLVDDPEAQIRALLAKLDLPFDQRCIDFHQNDRAVRTASSEQVRKPIFKEGLEQWRHYEPWLGALSASLAPVIDIWDRPAT
ncbi:MAG: sulfotransferase, partial [Alphaproteobacteria bacterium]